MMVCYGNDGREGWEVIVKRGVMVGGRWEISEKFGSSESWGR